MGIDRPIRLRCGPRHLLLKVLKAVQLLQTQGGRAWRIFGPGPKPIPAPQIAFHRHQSLPGFQQGLQRQRVFGCHQANLAHAPFQHFGHRHVLHQRGDPLWQRLCRVILRQYMPTRGAIFINFWGAQIIGKRRAQSFFKPLLNLQPVQYLAALSRIAFHQLGKRRHLCPQRVQLAFGL